MKKYRIKIEKKSQFENARIYSFAFHTNIEAEDAEQAKKQAELSAEKADRENPNYKTTVLEIEPLEETEQA